MQADLKGGRLCQVSRKNYTTLKRLSGADLLQWHLGGKATARVGNKWVCKKKAMGGWSLWDESGMCKGPEVGIVPHA